MIEIDTSTIDQDALRKLPVFEPNANWHLSKHLGSACSGEPPGHPSYFVQSVYARDGNEPRGKDAPISVICGHVLERNSSPVGHREAIYKRLYRPLPMDSDRVALWIEATLQHFACAYYHPTEQEYGRPKMIFYPVSPMGLPEVKRTFRDDPRFGDEWRTAEKARIAEENAYVQRVNDEYIAGIKKIATLENHVATQIIREYYPEFTPTQEQIDSPRTQFQTEWPYRYEHQPSADECPGHLGVRHGDGDGCRMCGLATLSMAQI